MTTFTPFSQILHDIRMGTLQTEQLGGIWPKGLWGVAINTGNLLIWAPSLAVRTAERYLRTSGLLQICILVKLSPCGFFSIARIRSSYISFITKEPNLFMKRVIVESNIPLRSFRSLKPIRVVGMTYCRMLWL